MSDRREPNPPARRRYFAQYRPNSVSETRMTSSLLATCAIAAAAAAGIVVRPFNLPEAVWAVAGAVLLVAAGLLSPAAALSGIGKGGDVYLFLIGMMMLAEVAGEEKLFDWLAAVATRYAGGSARRLFLLIYGVGILVTIFLSNDATAVVLTPAVAAAVKTAKAEKPLPYLLICAFIANAASFVLPISNPANLVIYGGHMPALPRWLAHYLLPSLVSIVVTFAILRWTQRDNLKQPIATNVPVPALPRGGKTAALGIAATAALLLLASALDWQLGLPTALAGATTAAVVLVAERRSPVNMIRRMSWSILPLVAGLFVIVAALDEAGLVSLLGTLLRNEAQRSAASAAWVAGVCVAFLSNLVNNLPAGLIAGSAAQSAQVPDAVTRAILIGVDLGPNLSVTGSLATILWLIVLRKEGQSIHAVSFLKLGFLVMPPALAAAIATALLVK
jgi:arsenical pump membrane protein